MAVFVPDSGNFVWLNFDHRTGHEQSGQRPVLVLSPRSYNVRSGLALVCPITSQAKGYPFEVSIPNSCGITGVILADQLKSVDWRARRVEKIGLSSVEVVEDVLARIAPLLGY